MDVEAVLLPFSSFHKPPHPPRNSGTRIGTVPDTRKPFRKAYTTVVLFVERSIMGRQTSIDGDPGMQAASIYPMYLATNGTISIESNSLVRLWTNEMALAVRCPDPMMSTGAMLYQPKPEDIARDSLRVTGMIKASTTPPRMAPTMVVTGKKRTLSPAAFS